MAVDWFTAVAANWGAGEVRHEGQLRNISARVALYVSYAYLACLVNYDGLPPINFDISLNYPAMLEDGLGKLLHFASHWKAVLLLDEADGFLEKRSPGMHTSNSLISVFLRTLEYFEGVMFLTTNRLASSDGAILSQVHLPRRFDNSRQAFPGEYMAQLFRYAE